jgi:hypothetical protein
VPADTDPVNAVVESRLESYAREMTSITELTRRARPAAVSPLGFRRSPRGAAGWAALLVPGSVTAAAVGLAITRGRPGFARAAAFAVGGVLVSVLIARAVDEANWRRSAVSLEVAEPDAALDLMQAVRAEGVRADMVRAEDTHTPSGVGYALRYRAKDDRRVRAVLAAQQR